MNPNKLAKHLAREIFKCGDYKGSLCTRIEFKARQPDKTERDQGGFCESALVDHLKGVLDQYSTLGENV